MSNKSAVLPTVPTPRASFTAGLTRKLVACPHNDKYLPVTFWYPCREPEAVHRDGIYDLRVALEAPPATGRYGLVVISHGSGGSDINHHDWAEALARAGYVVAAPRHLGDSHDVDRGIGSREQLLERPRQLRLAIEAALNHERLGGLIDRDRIGIVGFSAGCYTSLILLGACPDFSRWGRYCATRQETTVLCPARSAPEVPKPTREDWEGLYDSRIKAAVLMAPFCLLFDSENLKKVKVPVRLYRSDTDSVATNPENADHLAANLEPPPEVVTVHGGHYVFIAPIEPELAQKYPKYYLDAPNVDRCALHTEIARETIEFFERVFFPL